MNSNKETDDEECCGICGELMKNKYSYTLPCNHTFHYECILKTLKTSKSACNKCPYCRRSFEILEPVNGLKSLVHGIHFKNCDAGLPKYKNVKCEHIMTRGKNKGNICGKNCQLGFFRCGLHNKPHLINKDNKDLETSTNNVITECQ